MSYDTDMPVEQMVKRLCDLKQGYTQFGGRSISSSPFLAHFLLFFSYLASRSNPKFGVLILGQRPFGVSFLIAGYDPHHQFQVIRTVQRSKVYPPPPVPTPNGPLNFTGNCIFYLSSYTQPIHPETMQLGKQLVSEVGTRPPHLCSDKTTKTQWTWTKPSCLRSKSSARRWMTQVSARIEVRFS
jgi:hypothetical protein